MAETNTLQRKQELSDFHSVHECAANTGCPQCSFHISEKSQ